LATSARGVKRRGAQPYDHERFVVEAMPARAKFGLDAVDHAVGFGDAAVGHQPTRRFRQPHAHQEDDEAEQRADEKGEAPSHIGRQHGGIEQE
jgi:hypothetical protein